MAMSTPVNKKTLKHHFDYYKWKYLLLIVLVVAVWSLIYTVTRPVAPEDKRIDIYIQSNTTNEQMMHAFLDPVWKEYVPQEEELNLSTILEYDDTTAAQQLFMLFNTNGGDIYLLNFDFFTQYAKQGMFVPLDQLIKEGKLDISGIDARAGWASVVLEKNFDGVATKLDEQHLYGIPLRELYGFASGMQVDNQNLYACIAVNNGNMDDVVTFFNQMIQAGRGEKPDWAEQ